MDQKKAQASVERHLEALDPSRGEELCIIPDATRECASGWVFFYNSKAYVTSKDPKRALVGNAPVLVDRQSGKLITLGTAHPIDDYIAHYDKTGRVLGR